MLCKIISADARELYLLTEDNRKIYMPQHTIKKIEKVGREEFDATGNYVGEDRFATRYFFTTNGLPIKKGEHYIQWNLFGPDLQFGLGNNVGVGVITSWFGAPVIANVKKTWKVEENVHVGVGALVGTASWAALDVGGALPFASLTFGNRVSNLSFSLGYGSIWDGDGAGGTSLASIGGITKLSPKFSLVFDSFIIVPNAGGVANTGALIIPGLRWHQSEGKAFQFGFVGLVSSEGVIPIPIPMVQWYRNL